MVFSSIVFIFYFLPLALAACLLVPLRLRNFCLTFVSYLFYGWANPAFVVLMFGTSLVSWYAGREMAATDSPGSRRRWLWVGLIASLGSLGFFKYFNFGIDTWNALAATANLGALQLDLLFRVVLPLGLSFYTFQSISYVVDLYRKEAQPIERFGDYACYISMFPQLVAGPIIRYGTIRTQLFERKVSTDLFARGVAMFSLGLSKKVLLANPCGQIADAAFNTGSLSMMDAWLGLFGYSFQIYFDFSAYSDMAIGLGLMLGFVFPKNFDSPYKSGSITEFWRRWHISLSTWLRDYLYIPLGGNRRGASRTYVNLMVVMLLGGLWHGASWNFVMWGAWHGALLASERVVGGRPFYAGLPHAARVCFTFLLVSLGWVWFRAVDFAEASAYFAALAGLGEGGLSAAVSGAALREPFLLLTFGLAGFFAFFGVQSWDFTRRIGILKAALVLSLYFISVGVLSVQSFNPFIYFIF
ncbi:MAG: MBOAT family O-acyltransferase [Puniceicoccaceae bacterium]